MALPVPSHRSALAAQPPARHQRLPQILPLQLLLLLERSHFPTHAVQPPSRRTVTALQMSTCAPCAAATFPHNVTPVPKPYHSVVQPLTSSMLLLRVAASR